MNPFFNKNTPTVEELWKDEKSKYRKFAVGSVVSSIFLSLLSIALCLVSIFIFALGDGSTQDQAQNRISDKYASMVIQCISVVIILFITIKFLISIKNSYRNKSFEHLNLGTLMVFGFISFIGFIEILGFLIYHQNTSNSYLEPLQITRIVLNIIFSLASVVLYYAFFRNLRIIAAKFINARNFELFTKEVENMDPSNPLYNLFKSMAPEKQEMTDKPNMVEEPAEIIDNDNKEHKKQQIQKMLDLPIQNLYIIAEKLNISGYDKMDKEELANLIYKITNKK